MNKVQVSHQPVRYLPWIICGLAALFYFYEYMLRVMPSVMTGAIMTAYHLNARSFGNLSASYYYIYAPMQIVVGVLMDRYGPRRILSFAVFSCAIGTYLFASSPFLWVAEVGRLLVGLGSSFAFVGALKLATIWLPLRRFALISGTTVALGLVGGIVGDLALMALVNDQGWRLTHYFAAMLGLLLTVGIFLIIRDRKSDDDVLESIHTLPTLKEVCKGCMQLLKHPQIWINGLIGLLLYIPISGFAESWGIPYFKQAIHYSSADAASAASVIFLGWAIGAPITGWISDLIKQRRLPLTIGASLGAILISLVLYVPGLDKKAVFTVLFLLGFVLSTQVIVFPVSRENSSQALTGTAIALTNMVVMFAGISVVGIGSLLELMWKGIVVNGMHTYSLQTYQMALLVLPISLVLAVFLTFYLNETASKNKS